MIDWEEIIKAESVEELREAKLWLFQENMRLENLNRRMMQEKKRLKEENLFFEKKLAILQDGFRQLEEDRRCLDRERQMFDREKMEWDRMFYRQRQDEPRLSGDNVAQALFRNVKNNPLALRKRYKDLVKIFHPDNLFGDEELIQLINREFSRRRRDE